jgi:hypothetical protein
LPEKNEKLPLSPSWQEFKYFYGTGFSLPSSAHYKDEETASYQNI